jgi:TIR domain
MRLRCASYVKSVGGESIEFYSCFISYSTKDQDFADHLYADLQAAGARCWFAPHDIQGGRKIHEQIDEAIRLHDKLLLILSNASMSSNWVKTEIANARDREEKQKRAHCALALSRGSDRNAGGKLYTFEACLRL